MHDQLEKYANKLLADRSALTGRVAVAAKDDELIVQGEAELSDLASKVLERLNALSLVVATPSLAFADLLVARAAAGDNSIEPRDTETRTYLHDIPFVRRSELSARPEEQIARLLGSRKGVIVEGVGIVASGGVTVEQAYINYSSVFHSTFVKYLQDILNSGYLLPQEEPEVNSFFTDWLLPLTEEGLAFHPGPLEAPDEILREIATVGRYTVERGLVDSFFGNISCRTDRLIYISQTAASLDALAGCIDPVPFDNSSTVGITASSELAAHRRIYETGDAKVILHGHPKFSVVMSMLCERSDCGIGDCWRDCPHVRFLGGTPVVAGEIGAGGLAKRVPPVIAGPGRAIVYGHGVFTIGRQGFGEAFRAMVEVENWCREEYRRRLMARVSDRPR
ncbi:MAG TPA: class II aldolase/adducin family protein [Geobacteraceae bacterium]|nr:class II aldolase/adducin family protein [Geobacteraceae bacterium]